MMNWQKINEESPNSYQLFLNYFTKKYIYITPTKSQLMVTNDHFDRVIIDKSSGHSVRIPFDHSILYDFFSSYEIEFTFMFLYSGFTGYELMSYIETINDIKYYSNRFTQHFPKPILSRIEAEEEVFTILFKYFDTDAMCILLNTNIV